MYWEDRNVVQNFLDDLKALIEAFVSALLAAWDALLDGLGI